MKITNNNPSTQYRSVSRLTRSSQNQKAKLHKASHSVGSSLVSLFIAGLLIVTLVYALTWLPVFRIQSIEFSGLNRIDESKVKEQVWQEISNDSIPIWNKSSIFLFPSDRVKERLFKEEEYLQEMIIQRILPNSIKLLVKERYPTFQICDSQNCYLLANDGLVLESDPTSNLIKIKRSEPLTNSQQVYSERTVQWLTNLVTLYARNLELGVDYIEIALEGKSGILEVALVTPEGYPIRVDFETDIFNQQKVLGAVINEENLFEQRDKLEYIDLRIANRVYYRFVNQGEFQKIDQN